MSNHEFNPCEVIYDGYYEVDISLRFIYVNKSLCEILNINKSKLLETTFENLFHENDSVTQVFAEVRNTRESIRDFSWVYKRPDGKEMYLEASIALFTINGSEDVGFCGIIRNSTYRYIREEQIIQRENELQHLIDALPDPVFFKDADGRWLNANRSAVDLFNIANIDYIGKTDAELAILNPDFSESHLWCIQSDRLAWEMGEISRADEVISSIHGSSRTLDVIKVPVFQSNGERKGLAIIGRDVTDRKQAEQRMIESNQRNKSLVEYNQDAIFELDTTGRIIEVNPAAVKLSGLQKDETVGVLFLHLVSNLDLKTAVKCFRNTIRGEPQEAVLKAKFKPNVERLLHLNTVPIVIDYRISGIFVIAKDITEQRQMQEKIARLGRLNALILDSVVDGIVGIDTEGYMQFCNPAVNRLSGYSMNELKADKFYHIVRTTTPSGDLLTLEESAYYRALQSGVPQEETMMFQRKDGTLFLAESSVSPIRENERVIGAVIVIKDVTERQKSEYALLQSEKLGVLGQMAAGLAHEIRNPLTAIKGFTQLLKENRSEKSAYEDIMLDELSRIESIVNEFLILSKPGHLVIQRLGIKNLLDSIVTVMKPEAAMKNIELRTSYPSDDAFIQCEGDRLKQVFMNLIKNALDASRYGGHIEIEMNVLLDTSLIVVRVTDHGCGISGDEIMKLGQPFYTTKENGTGLGLAICNQIIRAHHGRLEIRSTVDVGTTFEVILPTMI